MTSEEKLGIDKPIEHQCSSIDKMVKVAKETESAIRFALKCDDIEDMRAEVENADWHVGDLENGFESLRTAIESVRNWGEQWKEIAKELINEYEPEKLEDRRDNDHEAEEIPIFEGTREQLNALGK